MFLWVVADSPRLGWEVRRPIVAAGQTFVSAASIREVAVKVGLGKIDADAVAAAIERSGFFELPVRAAHAAAVSRLALHHADPFDRLLMAQALTEPLRLLTADAGLGCRGDFVQVVYAAVKRLSSMPVPKASGATAAGCPVGDIRTRRVYSPRTVCQKCEAEHVHRTSVDHR